MNLSQRCSAPALLLGLASYVAACGTTPTGGIEVEVGDDAGSGSSDSAGADAIDAVTDLPAPTDTDPTGELTPGPDTSDTDADPIPPWPPACDGASVRSLSDRPRWNEPAIVGFTPDDGQIWLVHHGNWEGSVVRVRDGASLGQPTGDGLVSFDANWSRAAWLRMESRSELLVRDVGSDRELLRIDVGNSLDGSRASVAMHPDGTQVAWTNCSTPADDRGELRVARAVIGADREPVEIVIPVEAAVCYSYNDRTLLRWIDDALWIVPGLGGAAWVLRPDRALEGPHTLVQGPTDPDTGLDPEVVDLIVEPGARSILVAASTGEVRRWRLPGPTRGELVATTSVGTLNTFTFAPQVRVAPVAVSPDGRYLAWASAPNTVIVGSADGRESARFDIEIEPDEFGGPPESDRIATIAFSHDGDRLAVAHTGGIEIIGCPAPATGSLPTSITATIEGRARVGQPVTLRATIGGAGPWTHLSATAEGYPLPTRLFDSTAIWTPTAAGSIAVELVASDTGGEIRETLIVDVAP